MLPQSEILAQQIKRFMLSESDKQRLLDELTSLDETKLQQLSALIREHDQEALKVLDEKAGEQEKTMEKISAMGPVQVQPSEAEAKANLKILEEIFNDPAKLAQFLAASDDLFLHQLEKTFLKALENDPVYQEEFRHFFQEVRLKKAGVEKKLADEEKEALIQAILKTEEQSKKFDDLLAKADKILKTEK